MIRAQRTIPTIALISKLLGRDLAAIDASFARMTEGNVFVPRHNSHEIYAYSPFCSEPTAFRVRAGSQVWWAICAWEALGIPPALGSIGGRVETKCPDCREPIDVQLTPEAR